jgi:hypothetical protein
MQRVIHVGLQALVETSAHMLGSRAIELHERDRLVPRRKLLRNRSTPVDDE